jgi:hypothetical protein
MSPSQWGPPTWIFLHTLVAKIKDEQFPVIGQQVIANIIQICLFLPCPECSVHAKQFWANVVTKNINNKQDLINLLFVFHNAVNKRRSVKPFRYVDLQYYNTLKLIDTFNDFARNYNTNGNMKLLTESFHRSRLLQSLRGWLMSNLPSFHL